MGLSGAQSLVNKVLLLVDSVYDIVEYFRQLNDQIFTHLHDHL